MVGFVCMIEEPMSVQTDAIPSRAHAIERAPLYSGVAVTGSAAVAAGLGFAIVYILNRGIVPAVLVLTSAVGMGLVAGLVARFSLPRRSTLVRWVVALFGFCTGMIFLGWLSRGLLGLDLFSSGSIKPDWQGLLRFALGAATAWVAVRAWVKKPSSHLRSSPRTRSLHARTLRHPGTGNGSMRATSSPSGQAPASVARGGIAVTPRSIARRRSVARTPARVRKARPRIGSNRRVRTLARSAIRFREQVEHRCPFCLELVEQADARGVVECSVCHTLHHADCWAVTGTCQVPHYNS